MSTESKRSSICGCACHLSPLYPYRNSPDMALFYSTLNTIATTPAHAVVGGNVNPPEKTPDILSKGLNGGSPSVAATVATITTLADLPSILRG